MKFIGEKKQSQRNPNRILTMLEKQVTEMHQDHKPYNPPSTQHYTRSLPPQKVLLTKYSYPSRQETNPTPHPKKKKKSLAECDSNLPSIVAQRDSTYSTLIKGSLCIQGLFLSVMVQRKDSVAKNIGDSIWFLQPHSNNDTQIVISTLSM